jgi:hypothetical protein
MTTTKNKVVELSDDNQVLKGEGLKYGTEHFPTETRVGKPIGGFYLYRTDGIFQNTNEVNAHAVNGNLIQPNAQPGDIRFKDLNGDGKITDADKEYCGSGIPSLEANLNFSASSLTISSYASGDMYVWKKRLTAKEQKTVPRTYHKMRQGIVLSGRPAIIAIAPSRSVPYKKAVTKENRYDFLNLFITNAVIIISTP